MAALASVTPVTEIPMMHEKRNSTAERIATLPKSNEIRILSKNEYKEAAACLAEAFRDDHVVRYPFDTPDRMHWSEEDRFELHKQAMEYVVYAHCLKGLVTTVGPNYDCVALWVPPGKEIDLLTIFRSGMWRLNYQLSKEGRERIFKEFLPLLSSTKLEVLGERDNDSWYLNYIGTKAESRGKGYARKLIEHVTNMADEFGQVCYLESSHEINVKIYGKLGFKLQKQIFLKRSDEELRMDVMIREPVMKQIESKM